MTYVVTEHPISTDPNLLEQHVNGAYFSANGNVEYWREAIKRNAKFINDRIEDQSKSVAVLAYLEAKSEAEKAEARGKRRNELVDELAPRLYGLGKNWYDNVSVGLQRAVDRIIDLEEAAK